PAEDVISEGDRTAVIPDDCLALIFQFLSSGDRRRCSLICRRWLAVEGQSRQRLALNASGEVSLHLPAIFTRFDSVTKLALRCDRKSVSINDDDLSLISQRCRNLTRLKLRGCRELSDLGMLALARNCKSLRKFSCGSCNFGAKGMNALLNNCSSLEELSVKRLRGINDGSMAEPVVPGVAGPSLRSITLKELYNGQCFAPLVIGSKNLKSLKILKCLGDWDGLFAAIAERRKSGLTEIHLERLQVSDSGLIAISKFPYLDTFHLVKAPDCSDQGISAIADNCKLLRKLHIDGWRTNRIGDEGLISIAANSVNLVELVLIGVNPTSVGMTAISSKCRKLERLALCGSESIGDPEISCISAKCHSLKKLCIKCCRVTDAGVETFAFGCPNLVKVKVKKCKGVTSEVRELLKSRRPSLAVTLDADEIEAEAAETILSDDAADVAPVASPEDIEAPSTSHGTTTTTSKLRFDMFAGRVLVACAFQRLAARNNSS
ncbi:hypothetical protein M569_05387, partial [Genlisea aurea]